ncbi:hypothetical protein MPSEU_000539200 [Mayamaea pseudoterrestris]|nr:hypothetical protein MPSEU_000539200 [Mayamaea pseudoterrestris]
MVRQNSVKAAFSKPEAVRSSTSFITKCCRCCCLFVSLLVFLMILGAGSGPVNDNALSGQAHHASIQNKVNSSRARDYDATAWHYDKSSEYDYDEVENVVGEAKLILEKAE